MKKSTFQSIGAILLGMIAVFALSIITDVLLEKNGIMKLPFANNSFAFILFVILYRNIFVIVGSCIAVKLAPSKPMRHAIVFCIFGFILGCLGTIAMWHEPPHWYPITLIITGIPSALVGGYLIKKK